MVASTLASLQGTLADIYDLPGTPDVQEFLMTDRAHLASYSERETDEQLLVAHDGDTLSLALYIDATVLARLADHDPCDALTGDNLADYLTVAEGVSHFVYVAWNARHDKPVTLLELELQAEVDKYVLGAWLLREQGAGRFPRELHRALFDRTHVDPSASSSPDSFLASSSRLNLIHSPSLRRSRLPCGFAASRAPAVPTRAYGSNPDGRVRSTVSLPCSPRAGVDSMLSGARSRGTPARPASIHSTRALPRSSWTI
jgi:hypothetical protein